jgi:hypothetical protein
VNDILKKKEKAKIFTLMSYILLKHQATIKMTSDEITVYHYTDKDKHAHFDLDLENGEYTVNQLQKACEWLDAVMVEVAYDNSNL